VNIAILIASFPPGPASGAELQAQAWAEQLGSRHNVTVISRREPRTLPLREDRPNYTVMRTDDTPPGSDAGLDATTDLIGTLDEKPDLLLCFMTDAAGLVGVGVGRRLGIPAVVWIRAEGEYQLDDEHQRRVIPAVWEQADGVLVQSEIAASDLLAELQRVAPASVPVIRPKLLVVGNGVDLPEPTPVRPEGPVLSVGRLVPGKGMNVVIDACARAGRPLVIVGGGPERPALERQAAALGADVRFAGTVDQAELGGFYRDASVMVLASLTEGLPNVLLEAMSHGRPVVATPCGGIPDLIDDGVNGLLVPAGDSAALAAALDRLMAEPETTARLAAAGRRTVEPFAWDRLQPRLEEALDRWRRR
jgi:glycosyltransferase involved in cell wall biosynthesis